MASGTRIDAKGLKEAQAGLRAMDKSLPKKGKDILAKSAAETHAQVMVTLKRRPGGGTYSRDLVNVRPFATQRNAGIRATRTAKAPILHGFEFGAKAWHTPIYKGPGEGEVRRRSGFGMSRRVLPPWTGNKWTPKRKVVGDGWVVAPTITRLMPQIEEDLYDGFKKLLDSEMDKRGVPRG